jgi:hypothetical protein
MRNLHFNATHKGYLTKGQLEPNLGLFSEDGLHVAHRGQVKATQIIKNLVALWIKGRLTILMEIPIKSDSEIINFIFSHNSKMSTRQSLSRHWTKRSCYIIYIEINKSWQTIHPER